MKPQMDWDAAAWWVNVLLVIAVVFAVTLWLKWVF